MRRGTRGGVRAAAGLALLVVPLALAGGGSGTVRYTCTDGNRVEARYTGQQARVTLGGRVLTMNTALSGSGARYVGGGYTWWTKGNRADLYRGEALASIAYIAGCQGR